MLREFEAYFAGENRVVGVLHFPEQPLLSISAGPCLHSTRTLDAGISKDRGRSDNSITFGAAHPYLFIRGDDTVLHCRIVQPKSKIAPESISGIEFDCIGVGTYVDAPLIVRAAEQEKGRFAEIPKIKLMGLS